MRNTGSITFATKVHTLYQRVRFCAQSETSSDGRLWKLHVFGRTPLETTRNFFRNFALLVDAFVSVKGPVVGVWKIFLAKLFQPSSTSGFSPVQELLHLNSNLRTAMHYDTTIKPEARPPFLTPMTLELRSSWLLGRCLRHLHKSSAGTNMTKCRPGGVFVLLQ